MKRKFLSGLALLFFCATAGALQARETLKIGSKNFTESYLLAEIMAQLLEDRGFVVQRHHNLGGTLVCYRALSAGQIDLYPEYSGTISEAILKDPTSGTVDAMNSRLAALGLRILPSFGFNNTYAFVVPEAVAHMRNLQKIGDLRKHPDLRIALSSEFMDRADGWRPLRRAYDLPQKARGIEHGLAYAAIADGRIDLTDAYSTDAEVERYNLRVLRDDRNFFPDYHAAPLARADLSPVAARVLEELAGTIDESQMRELNARVSIERQAHEAVARRFLRDRDLLRGAPDSPGARDDLWPWLERNLSRLLRHILLTALALSGALLTALPLGILLYRNASVARPVLYGAGLLQTIPSIALLAFMIPLFGIGVVPAVIGLFLYAILPILRTTITALRAVDPLLVEVATGMGLTRLQTLRRVEIPLALPGLFAGVRVATVIAIGTATLAAFIGAGGLGEPIVTGLALNDPALILEGALPAAGLAIVADLGFDRLERVIVPAHLRAGRRTAAQPETKA